jgi:hypothetical protein
MDAARAEEILEEVRKEMYEFVRRSSLGCHLLKYGKKMRRELDDVAFILEENIRKCNDKCDHCHRRCDDYMILDSIFGLYLDKVPKPKSFKKFRSLNLLEAKGGQGNTQDKVRSDRYEEILSILWNAYRRCGAIGNCKDECKEFCKERKALGILRFFNIPGSGIKRKKYLRKFNLAGEGK